MIPYIDYGVEEQTPEQARLYETCLKGSREEIRNYCKKGDIASQFIKNGMNPMHVVAIAGRKDAEVILDMMLQNGFDVNVQTRSNEDTVLHLIVEHIDVKEAFPLVLKILEYQPDLNLRNRKIRTPYDIAVAKGEFELAEVLGGSMTAMEAREFYTQKIAALYGGKLIDAVLRSNETDIQDFIRLGADPNHVNEHKNGAIHYAITHCTLPPQKTLQMLIDGGADVNLQDDEGDTALNLVIKMTKLKDTGEMYTCADLLLQNGALSTYKDLDGSDALTLAKKRQYADIVKLLSGARQQHVQPEEEEIPEPVNLNNGLLVLPEEPESEPEPELDDSPEQRETAKAKDPDPPTPREPPPIINPTVRRFSVQQGITEEESEDDDFDEDEPSPPPMMPQLIMNDYLTPRRGILSNESPYPDLIENEDTNNWDHLVKAIREGTIDEVNEALFTLRADPDVPGDDGIYPIHHVLIRGEMENEEERMDMLRSLIEAGADINIKTVNSESTPLHVAATKNQDNAAQVLLDTHKCDYNLKNKHDKTAYDVAEEEECTEVMEVIENHRKKVRAKMQKAAKATTCTIL